MAHNGRAGSLDKPLNVEQIVTMAGDPQIDPQFTLQSYFRSADVMVKQANIYEREGNDQMAYFLLYRHAILVLDALPKHPQAKDPKFDKTWSQSHKTVNKSLQKLEVLRPRINKRYERHLERRKALAAQAEAAASRQHGSLHNAMAEMGIDENDRRPGKRKEESPSRLDPAQHRDMAVQLANREISRRSRRDQELRDEVDLAEDVAAQRAMQSTMNDTRPRIELPATSPPPRASSRQQPSSKTYNYPQVANNNDGSGGGLRLPSFTSIKHQPRDSHILPPQRPPKQSLPPAIPAKDPIAPVAPPLPSKTAPSPPPSPTPAHQFLPSAYLENGSPLRTIFFPGGLRASFLSIAAANTRQNLETCGILCGTLLRNAFFITKLVIPEQTSTSDTCEMVNEEALHAYCDAQPGELMVLGWIHTHPTQTAFMSSRDLHTHVWYQVQLPESIAVVCAPSRSPDFAIFRLTDPPGMDAIRACKLPGIFHPHEETHIFTDAKGRPGHVIEHEDLQFETVDLRPKGARGGGGGVGAA